MYRILNTNLECDFQLSELPQVVEKNPHLRVRLGSAGDIDDRGFKRAFEWKNGAGEVESWVERRNLEYLLVFPGYVRYHVSAEGTITCLPEMTCNLQTVRHLLLNQLVPRVLASNGKLVLHASAVTVHGGRTYAFLGNSGYGKSTLASSFLGSGAKLISDDCLLLEQGPEGVMATGGMPGIRLFPDSLKAVFDESTGFSNYTPYTDKKQLILSEDDRAFESEKTRIDAVFVLNDPNSPEPVQTVSVAPIGGGKAVAALINCAFSLDPSDQDTVVRNFGNLGALVNGHMRFYGLSFPRNHALLDRVKATITKY